MKWIATAAVAGLAAVAGAQEEFELGTGALDEGVQVEDNGAPFFMNAQGNDDDFAEFYVMRFDLSDYSGAPVTQVEIDLRHEETFFSNSGGVSLSYSTDDTTDLTSLAFDQNTVGGLGDQLDPSSVVGDFDFVDLPGDDSETIDTITLNDANGFFDDIQNQGVVTLVFQATDPETAATYAGIGNNDGGPVLRVIPAPGTAALLGLGGLVAIRRRRA